MGNYIRDYCAFQKKHWKGTVILWLILNGIRAWDEEERLKQI